MRSVVIVGAGDSRRAAIGTATTAADANSGPSAPKVAPAAAAASSTNGSVAAAEQRQSSSPSAVAATAAPAAATGAAPSSAADLNRSLLTALAEQFQRESLPWIQDLVVPLLEGPPRPLTGTQPPEQLVDRDSRFVTVNGVRLHYKMALPGEREGPAAQAAAVRRRSASQSPPQRPPAAAAAAAGAPSGAPAPAPLPPRPTPSPAAPQADLPSSSSPLKLSALLAWRRPPLPSAFSSSASSSLSSSSSSPPATTSIPATPRPPSPSPPGATASGGGDWSVDPPPNPHPDPDAAPTLLLMHGLNGSTFNWRLLMDDLAAYVSPSTGGCRVVAYDRPPYGLSQRPLTWQREEDNPYTLQGGARLAAGLLDSLLGPLPPAAATTTSAANAALSAGAASAASASASSIGGVGSGGGRAVLVGHSAGAAVAVETALRYPERVCGLVLIAPAISTDSRGFLARADLGQLLRFAWTRALLSVDGPGLNYVRRQVLRRKAEVEAGRLGIYSDEREVPQEVIDGYLRPLRAQDWDMGTLLVYRSLQVSGAPPPLEQLRVPVLVLQGREDRTVPMETAQAVTEALRRRGPGAVTELVVLERCGHVPMDEQPLEVLATVTDFLNRHCCG